MARRPTDRATGSRPDSGPGDRHADIPPEQAITRLYVLPPGSAAQFMAELEDETEEPTPALKALLRDAAD